MNFEIADSSTEKKTMGWNEAWLYCASLSINGKNDWRLPTMDELNIIYRSNHDFQQERYWSATDLKISAFFQDFSNGIQDYYNKNLCINVRAVRDL